MVGREVRAVWRRRRLMLLGGLVAALASKTASEAPRVAHAAGQLIGAPVGYAPYDGQADGVQGYAVGANNAGTLGRNNDLNGVGVYGVAPSGVGVHGESANGTGVGGRSSAGVGVYASSSTGNAIFANSASSVAIVGTSSNAYGVNGQSGSSIGMVGSSTSDTGVYGFSSTATGVVGYSPSGRAAAFFGPVDVYGAFTVIGGYPKSAAVTHPDGSYRRMFCVESPEGVFEDSGSGTLLSGRAQIQLDADFAAVVRNDSYQVFLTPEGDCKGLYVASKTPVGFEVRELQGGTSSIPFSFRILAKRKDLSVPRMERVTPLKLPAAPRTLTDPVDPADPTQPAR